MKRRTVIWVVVAAFAGLVVFRLYQQIGDADTGPGMGGKGGGPRGQMVEVTSAEMSTITERVSLVGSLRTKQRVEVTPKVSGRLVELLVDRGDHVRAGQVIARLEDDELRQQVRRAEAVLQVARASLAQREAELRNRKVELTRYRNLEQEGVVSSQVLEQSDTQVQVSEAQVNLAEAGVSQAQAELEELRIRLSQTQVVSPMTGTVGQRYVDAGALISATTPIVLILDLSRLVTVVNVPEREINKIEVGNEARIFVDAMGGQEFPGRVVRIAPVLDPQTRTGPVEIELANPEGRLKAEMFARVDLNLMTEREALLIPREALVYRGDRPGVFVVDSERALFRSVTTGLNENKHIEVVDGLSQAEMIVARGANLLKNGDPVRIVPVEGERAP
jgi:RND family efflux transporter MFP subunit